MYQLVPARQQSCVHLALLLAGFLGSGLLLVLLGCLGSLLFLLHQRCSSLCCCLLSALGSGLRSLCSLSLSRGSCAIRLAAICWLEAMQAC